MTTSLVITILANDRPGLVESVSEVVVAHGGEWVDSRMATLAGKFAGILQIAVPDEQSAALSNALQNASIDGLSVLIEQAQPGAVPASARTLVLDLLGQDRPGIVHKISQALAQLDINVEELETKVFDASMSGERMFQAKARLNIPSDQAIARLRDALEAQANELMVDIELLDDSDS
jgi:glycine cleavage system regulatory protein